MGAASSMPDSVTIARACDADLESLLGICRRGSPQNARWHGPRRWAVQWWETVLRSRAGETWVLRAQGDAIGFAVLVIDEEQWALEKPRRVGGKPAYLHIALRRPIRAARELWRRWRGRRGAGAFRADDDDAGERSVRVGRVWIELIIVDPSQQGRGMGRQLIDFCAGRGTSLDRHAVALCVDHDNEKAIRAYRATGFESAARLGSAVQMVKWIADGAVGH